MRDMYMYMYICVHTSFLYTAHVECNFSAFVKIQAVQKYIHGQCTMHTEFDHVTSV